MNWLWRSGWLLLCVLFLFPPKVSAKMVDGIVAVVNDDIILYSELDEQWALLLKSNPQLAAQNASAQYKVKEDLLRKMIRERLTDQEAKKLNIAVNQTEVDRAIEGIKKENGLTDEQLEVVISQQGQTPEQFREQIRREIERSRLIERVFKSKTVITDADVDAFLVSNKGIGKERRHLAVILLPVSSGMTADQKEAQKAKAETVYKQLQEGGDFAKLAKKYSQGPAVNDGGDIGFISSTDLAPVLEEATRNLEPGDYTDVLPTPGGFYIIKMIDVEREGVNQLDPNARERARRELMRREINNKYEKWIKDLENRSYIQINYGELKEVPSSTARKTQ